MGLIDAKSGQELKLSRNQLEEAAREMRLLSILSIHAAGSGHPGGSLSIMDIASALFLNEARLKPAEPDWDERDHIVFSAGHKAPALYVALAKAGFYTYEELMSLRKLDSPFQGHPHAPKLRGVEVSTGSLGQGLSISVGLALAGKKDRKGYRVYCIMGDGEQQEGSIWEAVMAASNYGLENLCAIVDRNRLQIDGWVNDVMNIDPLKDKYQSFGWHVEEINGHDMGEILNAFQHARQVRGRPTVIIANTVKGKGVSFMENEAGWHGVATKTEEQFYRAIQDISCTTIGRDRIEQLMQAAKNYQKEVEQKLKEELPAFSKIYWWNTGSDMKVDFEATRFGFGRCLEKYGDDPRVYTIHADISNSIKISDFEKNHPERKNRVISTGIAEQNMMTIAAGFALEGKIPVTGTYGVFAAGRPWDQLRTTVCYDNLNVKIGGAHGGISVGPDGATHQALEEISLMAVLPNMNVVVPCDSIETERLSRIVILDIHGPAYIRFAREATPVITTHETPLSFGRANVIRFRGREEYFKKAFDTVLADDYEDEGEDISLIACGPMVAEAMRAAVILKEECNIETRVLNIHTVKPIDYLSIKRAVCETGAVITCEEHQAGGFGNIIAGAIGTHKDYSTPYVFDMIGVKDRFGESGGPWELMTRFGLTAEHITEKAVQLLERKKSAC